MIVENKQFHSDEQWEALRNYPSDGPVCMVNLMKFKERAEYEDGRETDLTGIEAYQLYGGPMSQFVAAAGGVILHSSMVTGMIVGEVEELWDVVVVVQYPSRKEFIALVESPEVQALHVHRRAGLAGQLNIACDPL